MSDPLLHLTVLVADSSSHMAGLIGQMLRALKLQKVVEAREAQQAVAELTGHEFGLLLLDSELAGIDAIEMVRKLRNMADSPNRHIPIIMMSSVTSASRIEAARDAGVTEFLRKPFAPSHLEARIRTTLDRPRDFVEVEDYTGPDRRRKVPAATAPKRRSADQA